MNFLAHLYLSSPEPDALAGSLMPDLVRGPLPVDAPSRITAACRLHRCIDAFTDTHPLVALSKQRVNFAQSRYAGILVDIFYDHFLARDWDQFSDQPLCDYVAHVYRSLDGMREHIPVGMHEALDHMIKHNWLENYAQVQGIELTLQRMSARLSKRFKRPVDLAIGTQDLLEQNEALAEDFHAFFPQLIAYASKQEPHVGRAWVTCG